MVLWRISNHATLDGRGGLVSSARWHTRGRPIIYLAHTPAGALIEAIVHLELGDGMMPDTYQLLKLEVAETVSRDRIEWSSLEEGWEEDLSVTRRTGDEWLRSQRSALLEVPSVIVPETGNWLLQPRHPDARNVSIEWSRRFPYDRRLFRPRGKSASRPAFLMRSGSSGS